MDGYSLLFIAVVVTVLAYDLQMDFMMLQI